MNPWMPLDLSLFRELRKKVHQLRQSSQWPSVPQQVFPWRPLVPNSEELIDFRKKILQSLKIVLQPDEGIFVLDYFHECYQFFPKGFKNADEWKHNLWSSNGDALDIITSDLRLGLMTSYDQARVTVFGKSLLAQWSNSKQRPKILKY